MQDNGTIRSAIVYTARMLVVKSGISVTILNAQHDFYHRIKTIIRAKAHCVLNDSAAPCRGLRAWLVICAEQSDDAFQAMYVIRLLHCVRWPSAFTPIIFPRPPAYNGAQLGDSIMFEEFHLRYTSAIHSQKRIHVVC